MKLALGILGVLMFTTVYAQPPKDSVASKDRTAIPDSTSKEQVLEDSMPEPLEPISNYIYYPDSARDAGLEGKVVLTVLIDEEGLVTKVKIESSTDPIFEEPARNALLRVRFKPAMENGKPIKVWYTVPISYKIPK